MLTLLVGAIVLTLGAKAISLNASFTGSHIDVHIIAHTHDDVGWLMPVDDYYIEEVQWIFYTMIDQLLANSHHKFSYVEFAYFQRWWNEQDETTKSKVRTLVNNGQLQVNLGGWCMNDEASPTTSEMIQQMTDGAQFILNNLGENARPTTGWHVDPFGHSFTVAGLWAEIGFDAFGINRINYEDLSRRKANKDLEFIWKGSTSLGDDGYIFAHILDSFYCWPDEINFEGETFVQNDPSLPSLGTNIVQLAETFISDARNRATWFRHNHILIPWGCDFAHQNAYETFIQMDKLMTYINSNQTYNASVYYSTLANYVEAVHNLNLTWTVEHDDFFNYIDGPHSWWTGYFTSRPELKGYIRSRENVLRVGEHFLVFAQNMGFQFDRNAALSNITYLRYAIDSAQHHDAISGTATQDTTDDYTYMLQTGSTKVEGWLNTIAGKFLNNAPISYGYSTLGQLNANNYVAVVVYNSLAWTVTRVINLPFNITNVVVYDSNQTLVPSQVNPVPQYAQPYYNLNAKYSLYFLAHHLAPLSFTTFFVKMSASEVKEPVNMAQKVDVSAFGASIDVGKGYYTIYFDSDSGLLTSIQNNELKQLHSVRNDWYQWVPTGGIYQDGLQNSGAYIFRPAQDNRYCLSTSNSYGNVVVKLAFRQNFTSSNPKPGLIGTAHASNSYTDTFASTVCFVDSKNFAFSYVRLDSFKNGWGQNPYFDFISFDTSSPFGNYLLSGKEYGTKTVTSSSTSTATVYVQFDANTFTTTPRILTSVRTASCDGSAFVTTLGDVNYTTAVVYIKRIDSNSGWTDSIYLDWLAWEAQDSSEFSTEGAVVYQLPSNSTGVKVINITYTTTNLVVNEPVVLVQIQQFASNSIYYYGVTAVGNNKNWFEINLLPWTPSGSETVTLRITYWAFEREALIKSVASSVDVTVMKGVLFDEITQVFKENYSQTFRVWNYNYTDLRYIENDVHLGPLDQGAEFITHFSTEFDSNYSVHTCQNALEYVHHRYNPYIDERFGGNYYPCSSQAALLNGNGSLAFATIVDRAHGVGVTGNGEFDLMLHRRCLSDDSRGVGEVLNETTHIEPSIYILLDSEQEADYLGRRLFFLQQFKPTLFFGVTSSISQWKSTYKTNFTAAINTAALPDNIHLNQLRYAYNAFNESQNNGLILQLQHMFESNESVHWSTNETINLGSLFNPVALNITMATEMTLTANLPLSNLNRLKWNIQDSDGTIRQVSNEKINEKFKTLTNENLGTNISQNIQISPRQIRTFVLNREV